MTTLDSLPVELIADILSELDLETLVHVSQLSRRFNVVVSDPALNPWRRPILRELDSGKYHKALRNLSVRQTVPRHNWIEILSLASPSFILFDTTLPNLKAEEWRECFSRRFLPSWRRWTRQDTSWKAAFLKVLHRVWHRTRTSCTVDEAWTKYIVLHRKGHANLLEASTRNFNPITIFNQLKLQSNLIHVETRIRLVVELMDVRVIAFGTLNTRSPLTMNLNAHTFLHPPGADNLGDQPVAESNYSIADYGAYPLAQSSGYHHSSGALNLTQMTHPHPASSHKHYPWYTPGGFDKRWLESDGVEEEGRKWVGSMMIVAQLRGPRTHEPSQIEPPLQDLDLITGPGRHQYASFVWNDLWAIAPWLEERVTRKIDGQGLGN
ncbi:hypothetical protein E1B28_004649 [Marasmius oreades]|uniref:F-box domain-containing protein n=1 Tax=Marasmius oreades TaxID=181124 RepID=A0A9P7UZ13_9AGAR|nr:uncharacterized protein E1B28_004649 [Marasmius oreades]KAG7097284.1 hypothetical protein E1B28_004649 [Marasmius oreades]